LQAQPEQRLNLKQIAAHPWFTRPTSYMPSTLPESALHECPRLVQMNDFVQSSAAYNFKEEALQENYFAAKAHDEPLTSRGNNENDPNAANRMNVQAADRQGLKKDSLDASRPRSSGLKSTVPGGLNVGAPASGSTSSALSSTRSSAVRSQSTAPFASAAAVYSTKAPLTSSAATSTATYAATANSSSATTAGDRTKPNPFASAPVATSARPSSRGYGQKFDIYVDNKPQTASSTYSTATTASQQAGRKRDAPESVHMDDAAAAAGADRRGAARGKGLVAESQPSSVPAPALGVAPSRKPQYEFEIDRINTDFEQVQIAGARSRVAPPAVSTPPAVGAATKQAWDWVDSKPVFPPSHAVAAATSKHMSTPPAAAAPEQPAPAAESEAMCISTPQDQVVSGKECKPLGTLETMHEMLNNSFSVVESGVTGLANRGRWSGDTGATAGATSSPTAKVWVVRYVDYTSKYGLGFLFNTGSAGVYFNDSTKIVLSADGTVFQYTERRRRSDCSNLSEHTSQKHLITCYPPELQKKVTLLKHFRNYLLDQEKNSAPRTEGGEANAGLIKEGVVSDGACPGLKFGQSSTRYSSAEENNNWKVSGGPPDSPMATDEDDDMDMPFLKKWVRTKHAILFRISNRTVQVVFYDRR
jgi:hypothetical protein